MLSTEEKVGRGQLEAEEEKPRERPPLGAYQPDRFSSHVFVMADPHSTPYAQETVSTSRARSQF